MGAYQHSPLRELLLGGVDAAHADATPICRCCCGTDAASPVAALPAQRGTCACTMSPTAGCRAQLLLRGCARQGFATSCDFTTTTGRDRHGGSGISDRGVLPHVVAEQHAAAVHQRRVLVGGGWPPPACLCASTLHHRPAGAELCSARARLTASFSLSNEPKSRSIPRQASPARRAALASHHRPEHRVVGVPAGVVAHRGADRFAAARQACSACRTGPWPRPADGPSPPHCRLAT